MPTSRDAPESGLPRDDDHGGSKTPQRDGSAPQFSIQALGGPLDVRSTMMSGLFVLAVMYTLYFARAVLMPIAVAVLLAILLSPLVNWLSRRLRLPSWAGSMLILSVTTVAVAVTAYSLSGPATEWARTLPNELRDASWKLRDLMAPVEELQRASKEVEGLAEDRDPDASVPVRIERPGLLNTLANWAPRTLFAIGLTVALLYFLLASGSLFVQKLVRVIPTFSDKKRAVEIVHSIRSEISRYILTITLINIGLGVAVGLAMWALGMPNAALWGMMATVFNFVPYLGAIVGLAVVSLVALVTFEALPQVLLVAGCYAGLTALEGNFVTPSVLGRSLPLNAVVIFIGLIFWAWIWGVPGAFLAVPILAAIKIICDRVEQLSPIGEFLGR